MRYSHRSSFFWKSDLSKERMDEIVEWCKSLTKNEQDMLEDMFKDIDDSNAWYEGYEG